MKEWGVELGRDKQLVLAQIRHSGRQQARVLEVELNRGAKVHFCIKSFSYILNKVLKSFSQNFVRPLDQG